MTNPVHISRTKKFDYPRTANAESEFNKPHSRSGLPLHHLSLDLRHRHLRQIGRPDTRLLRGRGFLAPLLPSFVLLIIDDVVEFVRDVDRSLRRIGDADEFGISGNNEGYNKEDEEKGFVVSHGF